MKTVAKYNTLKGVSTAMTIGTPMATLLLCGDLFVHRSETAISACGVMTILILALVFKDKILENFKVPSAFMLCAILLVLIYTIKNIIVPMEYVCWATLITSGIDEFTFKQMYKRMEIMFPEQVKAYKHLGFILCKTEELEAMKTNG